MMRQLALAPLVTRSLFSQGLPTNTVLTGLANARFRPGDGFAADHAFFGRLDHRFRVSQTKKLSIDQSMILICVGFSTTTSKPYCG
jgi:hypothetical protein